jgi:proteic killer suppression protein
LVIRSCRDKETEKLVRNLPSRRFQSIERAARVKLAALSLRDLSMPGMRLEKLAGDREGECSIRINDQYRIGFEWRDDGAYDVEVTDYH